ncbi:NAD(P)H-hydrate epimerase [Microbacterium sp. ET2]|uniref:NAD(P)H-hydrate epimerase n=1 Tax=Microbacterium albipurpureum TaxID=3050384 RepID=UPI00259C820B|nr:NAD(P)H-hydrate epimerase [Microbacterium sp. ET2 (Ac-2212)]WJL97367.1 NAD(P)H-hydrate epimerase [Microbacterium sp. ET2 (Ac-2212)]
MISDAAPAAHPRVPTYRAADIRAAEAPLLAAGAPLMARAAHALAKICVARLAAASLPRVLVLAGRGDNGGDALFAGAELAAAGARVDVLLTGGEAHGAGLAAAVAAGARIVDLSALDPRDEGIVLDGMIGLGGRGSLRGGARDAAIALVSEAAPGRRVLAVDLPSGLDPDTGEGDQLVLAAHETITFGAAKAGLALRRGPALSGRITLVDIGLGPGLADAVPVGETEIAEMVRG